VPNPEESAKLDCTWLPRVWLSLEIAGIVLAAPAIVDAVVGLQRVGGWLDRAGKKSAALGAGGFRALVTFSVGREEAQMLEWPTTGTALAGTMASAFVTAWLLLLAVVPMLVYQLGREALGPRAAADRPERSRLRNALSEVRKFSVAALLALLFACLIAPAALLGMLLSVSTSRAAYRLARLRRALRVCLVVGLLLLVCGVALHLSHVL
jgi:uncharacterized membrane protein